MQIGKEEVKLTLFADGMILYMENPKDSTKKLLQLINEFSEVTGYKINTQKLIALLYTNNEATEREIKKPSSFTITPRTIRYLGTNLTKAIRDLYLENYRKHIKEIKEDTKKWKNIPCSWTGRRNIVKMSITTQSNLHIQCNPNQGCTSILRARTNNPTICMEPQKSQIAKVMLKKKTKAGGITIPDVSLYYKAAIIKAVYCRHKKRRKGEWNRESRNGPTNVWPTKPWQSR